MYQFIEDQKENYTVEVICNTLRVSRSSYYAYLKGDTYQITSKVHQEMKQVKDTFMLHRRRYGSRRVAKTLNQHGVAIGRFKVRRLMKDQSLKAIQPRSFVPKTTNSKHCLGFAPNVLAGVDFPSEPNEVFVGDITYLPTTYGQWLYLNVWIDLFSRTVVGWKVDTHMEESLVIDSLNHALVKRRPRKGIIIHSDRGGQYAGSGFKSVIGRFECIQSMSGADNPYDNAFAESFFSRFKSELLEKGAFQSQEDAQTEIFQYIEMYYNTLRMHSGLDYLSPKQYEELYYKEAERDALV